MRHLLLVLALLVGMTTGLARAEDDAPDEGAAKTDDKPAIQWADDLEVAKTQAAKDEKGLFVYLTPDWFH